MVYYSRVGKKGVLPAILIALLISPSAWSETSAEAEAAFALIRRVTPAIADQFKVEIIPSVDARDVFEIESVGDRVILRGNNGVSVASAYNRYLQEYCKCLYSLWGDQMHLPRQLPTVAPRLRVVTARAIRHFFNYCTFNYSGSWWDWKDWERIIDFLAMNGVNMPLNIVGTESAWYHTLVELGLSEGDALKCLPAPVYLNWQWMGNLEGSGGPLPRSWVDSHERLGRQIMDREKSLGMTPILHGFSGVVPRIFRERFLKDGIKIKPEWARGSFIGTATLDPMAPLFRQVETKYLTQLIRRIGTAHHYIIDPFHESSPPVDGAEYLRGVAKAIDATLLEVDPHAVWVTQDWTLRPEIIKSIPRDRLIIMSLTGGKVGEYRDWGYRYTIGQLNSFGGETHLHGALCREAVNEVAEEMRHSKNCVGSGNWMEGLENSPSYYHFMLDMNWESGAVNLEARLNAYCERRYGGLTDQISAMNRYLIGSVYQRGGHGFSSVVAARPALFPIKSSPVKEIEIVKGAFDKHVLAWQSLLMDRNVFSHSKGYQYDVVDLGRQVLSYLAIYCQRDTALYVHRRDLEGFRRSRKRFLGVLDDMDALLGTCDNFLFGRWISDARRWGGNDIESDYYAKYAATLVTLWGQDNPECIAPNWQDYAWREWSGLIKHYYRKRWEMFYDEVESRLIKGEIFVDVIRDKWARPLTAADNSGFYKKMYDFESSFGDNLPAMPSVAIGDAVTTSWEIFQKYRKDLIRLPPEGPILAELFEPATFDQVPWAVGVQRSVRLKKNFFDMILAGPPYFID